MPVGLNALSQLIRAANWLAQQAQARSQAWSQVTAMPEVGLPQGLPSPLDMYGGPGLAAGPLLPGARSIIRQAPLGASWFRGHGGSRPIEDVLREGFQARAKLQKVGEPLGVSLSSQPRVARQFSGDQPILRVAVDVPPEQVLDLGGTIPGSLRPPERAQDILRAASRDVVRNYRPPGFNATIADVIKEEADRIASQGNVGYWSKSPLARAQSRVNERLVSDPTALTEYNAAVSKNLRDTGYEAVAYHPERYHEYELRVLDPRKAIPVGTIDPGEFRTAAPKGQPTILPVGAALEAAIDHGALSVGQTHFAKKFLAEHPEFAANPLDQKIIPVFDAWMKSHHITGSKANEILEAFAFSPTPWNPSYNQFGEGALFNRFQQRFNPRFSAILEAANKQTTNPHLKDIYKKWEPEEYVGAYKAPASGMAEGMTPTQPTGFKGALYEVGEMEKQPWFKNLSEPVDTTDILAHDIKNLTPSNLMAIYGPSSQVPFGLDDWLKLDPSLQGIFVNKALEHFGLGTKLQSTSDDINKLWDLLGWNAPTKAVPPPVISAEDLMNQLGITWKDLPLK